jgi:glycosyltransferase involved in cell wall biosynthesis
MRVVVLVRTRAWGGLEAHASDLVRSLARSGHVAQLACIGQPTADLFRARDAALPIQVLGMPPRIGALSHWTREFRRLRADACVFEKGTLHAGSLALDAAARRVFGRGFVTIEQLEPPVLGARASRRRFGVPGLGLWWYRQRFSGWTRSVMPHRIICISEAVRRGLESDYGFPTGRMIIIPNGVDVDRFHPSRRLAARREHGIPEDAIVLATACRLIPQKGVDVALRAFARVLERRPDARILFLVAGAGPERERLERLAAELDLCHRVRFLGFIADTARFVPAADVFMVPSRIEAQGIIVLEAMASGCEVIASRVGGIPEMIRDPRFGTLVPHDNPEALAEAIAASLARLTADRSARASAARHHVVTHFSAGRQSQRVVELLRGLSVRP